MHIQELFQGEGRERIRRLLDSHGRFLRDVFNVVSGLVSNNEEVFRRDPERRLKKVASIHGRIDLPGMNQEAFFKAAGQLEDIAGIRLTIGTKDQHEKAEALVRETVGEFGELRSTKDGGLVIREDGYSANHLSLRSSAYDAACCEIQIRTLAQDLWAVLSHYEAYKRSRSHGGETVVEDLVNYAKLMDVADDYAKIIRQRKIREANQRHRKACSFVEIKDEGPNGILDFDMLDEIVNMRLKEFVPRHLATGAVGGTRLCDLLERLSGYQIYTGKQLLGLLGRGEYVDYILKCMGKQELENPQATDVFFILCECYKSRPLEVDRNEMGVQVKGLIDSHVTALRMERDADRIFEREVSDEASCA